ncbi:MAG TPA: DUF4330 domain-containing protein, partial [Allocoleopsis sp.]
MGEICLHRSLTELDRRGNFAAKVIWDLSLRSYFSWSGAFHMAILDSKGRLFGKISILDLGAALIILMVVAGIFLFPGGSGSVAQVGTNTKPIEVDVMVRGLTVRDPQALI